MENGLAVDTDGSEKALEQDSGNLDDMNPATKAKSASKDKKAKNNETPSKLKGRYSPKSTKDKKLESIEVKKSEKVETEAIEIEVETKDKKATKKVKKEAEPHHTTSEHTQPTVNVLRLNPQMLMTNLEMTDSSVVEIPIDNSEEVEDVVPSTSSDWPAPTRASPRRSTRLQEQKNVQDESIIIVQKNDKDDSVLVMENESESVTEVSRSSKHVSSFAEALIGMRGRRPLRPLPPLNLPSRQHTFSSRVPNSPDPAGQELKTSSFSSVFHKSSKSVTTTTNDLAADNDVDDAANSSSAEESGTEVDATSSEPSSTAEDVNMSGKRKISNIQSLDEVEHEHKRFRSINEEQINSSGFLSMISSSMNAFAFYVEKSDKENLEIAVESQSGQSETPQKKWCNTI